MLFKQADLTFDDKTWRRINMRKVSHLMGAEMIHNLYNRHWPYINSLRFRHTITNFHDGVVESYAPTQEWSYMQHWLSQKFINLDPILIREIENILKPSYKFTNEIMQTIDSSNLEKISNSDLALLLIDIMDFPLGDIYKLNVVQIEYSLNFALHTLLEEYEPNSLDRNELLAQLLAPGRLTIAQKEEIAFGKIMTIARKKAIRDPLSNKAIVNALEKHCDHYAPMHCAYGEEPPTLQDYIGKYIFMYDENKTFLTQEAADENIKTQYNQSKFMLDTLNNPRITALSNLMAKIGVFRDYNKAKLGETVIRRLRILDEIARRTGISRRDIDLYLMSEITCLLDTGESLSSLLLNERREKGVRFIRNEELCMGTTKIKSTQNNESGYDMQGICASPGIVTGEVRIILSKNDIDKVSSGDIMVAVGTDFDLLEIMNLSSGIITEEGGLLSHASVVSRELKKPCLIGVANATQLLHDGDRLKLDATKGKITILRKNTNENN